MSQISWKETNSISLSECDRTAPGAGLVHKCYVGRVEIFNFVGGKEKGRKETFQETVLWPRRLYGGEETHSESPP